MQDSTLTKDLLQLKAYHEAALDTINRRLAKESKQSKAQPVNEKIVAQAIAKRKAKIFKS